MTLFGSGTVNGLTVINDAQTVAKQVRDAMTAAENFHNWILGQLPADLIAAGVASPDVTTMQSMGADLNDLYLKYMGGTGDGNHPVPYNYSAGVNIVCGPQQ